MIVVVFSQPARDVDVHRKTGGVMPSLVAYTGKDDAGTGAAAMSPVSNSVIMSTFPSRIADQCLLEHNGPVNKAFFRHPAYGRRLPAI